MKFQNNDSHGYFAYHTPQFLCIVFFIWPQNLTFHYCKAQEENTVFTIWRNFQNIWVSQLYFLTNFLPFFCSSKAPVVQNLGALSTFCSKNAQSVKKKKKVLSQTEVVVVVFFFF